MSKWKPKEIIVHKSVINDPVTKLFLKQCPKAQVSYVNDSKPKTIVAASNILSQAGSSMIDKIISGKQVAFLAPATNVVDEFTMPDNRIKCPHFSRLKLEANGCFYHCDWCYLKLTYRAAFPFITVRAQFDEIKNQLQKRLNQSEESIIFSCGELADSLSMEHLTGAGREFIPWFGKTKNGYLYMLTKSANVDDILDLPHNNHTLLTWSINNATVSRQFEIGAPGFETRLEAAYKAQQSGYTIRTRLDPIVPLDKWQDLYSTTVKAVFKKISPERITLGTLRFEEAFYNMRNALLTSKELIKQLDDTEPMFPPIPSTDKRKSKKGRYSYPEEKRIEIFSYIINEIRKYSDCSIALCKESAAVWEKVGLDLSKCRCVCQYDYADMTIE